MRGGPPACRLVYTAATPSRAPAPPPQLWDIAKGTESCVLLGHKYGVTALCLADDKSLLFSGDAGGTLMVWLGGSYDHVVTVFAHSAAITAIGYCTVVNLPAESKASKGTIVFTGAADGSVKAWRADTGAPWELQVRGSPEKAWRGRCRCGGGSE